MKQKFSLRKTWQWSLICFAILLQVKFEFRPLAQSNVLRTLPEKLNEGRNIKRTVKKYLPGKEICSVCNLEFQGLLLSRRLCPLFVLQTYAETVCFVSRLPGVFS